LDTLDAGGSHPLETPSRRPYRRHIEAIALRKDHQIVLYYALKPMRFQCNALQAMEQPTPTGC